MGALNGTITASAYYVEGDLPPGFREAFLSTMETRGFREIDAESEDEESLGWVSIDDPFDTAFALEKVFWGSYALFALRQDVLRIPAAAFKLHLRKALSEYLAQTGKERASKADQEEVRDHLQKQLRKRVLPAIKVHDVVWNLDRKELWLFTSNKRVNEIFMDLFTDTFERVLIPRNPYSRLERKGLDDDALERAAALEPTVFALPPATAG